MSSAVIADRPAVADSHAAPLGGADISEYLHTLYDAARDGKWFVVAAYPSKRCKAFPATFDGMSAATLHIEGLERQHAGVKGAGVYTSMGLQDEAPSSGRGTAADVRALTCLWIDIDLDTGEQKKAGYARDIVAARGVVAAMKEKYGLSPSMLTSSGYGLHAYYIFHEPLSLADDDEHKQAVDLLSRWKSAAVGAAAAVGCKIDLGPFELARVMRVSGSTNWKDAANPKPARIIERHDVRYTYDDFDAVLPPPVDVKKRSMDRSATSPSVDVVVGDLVLRADAKPPFEKFEALMAGEPKFKRTWERDRSDMGDQSGSAYDLSLANFGVTAAMTDQEIANLLIFNRAKHADELKLDRPDYYAMTIRKARERDGGLLPVAAVADDGGSGADLDARESSVALLKRQLAADDVHISGVRKLGMVGGHFELLLTNGRTVPLGTTSDATDQRRVRNAIADVTTRLIKSRKPREWQAFAQAILTAAGPGEDIGNEEDAVVRGWLSTYLEGKGLATDKAIDLKNKLSLVYGLLHVRTSVASGPYPLRHDVGAAGAFWTTDRRLVIRAENLVGWLTSDAGVSVKPDGAKVKLARLGFTHEQYEERFSWKALRDEFEITGGDRLWALAQGRPDQDKAKRSMYLSPPGFDLSV